MTVFFKRIEGIFLKHFLVKTADALSSMSAILVGKMFRSDKKYVGQGERYIRPYVRVEDEQSLVALGHSLFVGS